MTDPLTNDLMLSDSASAQVIRFGDSLTMPAASSSIAALVDEGVAAYARRGSMAGKKIRILITREEAAKVGASDLLAVDRGMFGRMLVLSDAAPVNGFVSLDAEADAEEDPYAAPTTKVAEGVATVSVFGPLCQRAEAGICGGYVDGYDAIGDRFEAACADPAVNAIVLRLDSPGGDVAGLEQMVDRCVKARDASGKPVLVFIDELAASAAYWIAAAVSSPPEDGGGIFLTVAGRVGSIGVIAGLVDESEAWKREGIDISLIRWPDGKAESHPAQPVMPLAVERITARVKACAGRFFGAMAAARGKTSADIAALNADVFEGADAVRNGLANGVVKDMNAVLAKAGKAARKARSSRDAKARTMKTEADLAKFTAIAAKHGADSAEALDAKIAAYGATIETLKGEVAKVGPLEAKVLAFETAKAAADKADATAKEAADLLKGRRLSPHAKASADKMLAEHGVGALKTYLEGVSDMPTPSASTADRAEPETKNAGTPIAHASKWSAAKPKERADFRAEHGEDAYSAWKAAG